MILCIIFIKRLRTQTWRLHWVICKTTFRTIFRTTYRTTFRTIFRTTFRTTFRTIFRVIFRTTFRIIYKTTFRATFRMLFRMLVKVYIFSFVCLHSAHQLVNTSHRFFLSFVIFQYHPPYLRYFGIYGTEIRAVQKEQNTEIHRY